MSHAIGLVDTTLKAFETENVATSGLLVPMREPS
jgi:hypothetical protein